jgi:NTE family protein
MPDQPLTSVNPAVHSDPMAPGWKPPPNDPDPSGVDDCIALCLSGGGYRAMVFHVGVLWRLNEAGVLPRLDRISCVSGGSITGAVLGLTWKDLKDYGFSAEAFEQLLVAKVRAVAGTDIDAQAIVLGAALPVISASDLVARDYRNHIFGEATLQSLPDWPMFVFNATNVQSGALCRFTKQYMWDWRVGKIPKPDIELAVAVGASSAFPPFLSPVILKVKEDQFAPGTGDDLQAPPYTTRLVLTDGGVYDNLGLETAFKRCRTLLVSDAGGQMQPEEKPNEDWGLHSKRVLDLVDNQVRNLRKRQLLDALKSSDPVHCRKGAFWSVRSDISDYDLPSALPAPFARTQELAATPTRLAAMPKDLQERLINWGYTICDAAIRKHWDQTIALPRGLPYSGAGI